MNYAVMDYVSSVLSRCDNIQGETLELGSYDVNGSVRSLFADRERFPGYLGIDIRDGPGVDLRMVASDMHWRNRFNVIVSTEMLEHDSRFWRTAIKIYFALKPMGHLILTTRNVGYERHDYPSDYWRFTADGLKELFQSVGLRTIEAIDDEQTKMSAGVWIKPR